MLGYLLIRNKNGRGVITYGVKHNNTNNMRIALTCAAIFISCNVCASGDLDIFSGWKLSPHRDHYLRPFSDEVSFSRFYQNYLSKADDKETFKNKKIPQALKDLEELFSQRRKLSRAKAQAQAQTQSYMRYMLTDPELFKIRKPLPYGGLGSLAPSSQQMLEDVRPYPHEDSDFTFREEEANAENENDFEQEREAQEPQVYFNNNEDEYEVKSNQVPPPQQTKETTIINPPVLDDPTQFAYAPSDPRYYENEEDLQKAATPGVRDVEEEYNKKTTPMIDRRSEVGESTPQEGTTEEVVEPIPKGDYSVDGVTVRRQPTEEDTAGVYIIAMIAGVSAAATVGLIAFGIGWYNLQKHVKNASDVEYPAYGVTGPNKEVSPSGDRRLAQSAQMYHYQHQKQQIIAMESRAAATDRHGSLSEADSEEENEEGDYTVYECPGLAPTGEMEVRNPLFQDDPTPAQTPAVKTGENNQKK